MTALTRWDPFRELATMRTMMDNLFDERFMNLPRLWEHSDERANLALDVLEENDKYIVNASVPGVKPEDIDVTVSDNVLTIKGETKEEKEVKEANYHLRERRVGSFMRSIALPSAVKSDAIEAVNEQGVLTLTLPKSEEVKPKKIAIKTVVNGK